MNDINPERALIEAVAAGIAHEVRNPLNAMLLHVRILEQELGEIAPNRSQRAHQILAKLGAELAGLERFVGEFLRFARPPSLRIESVPVRPLFADLRSFVEPECRKKGVELRLEVEASPATVLADGFQLKHAVINLVLNSLQATEPGGVITLRISGVEELLVVEVDDTGAGIAAGMENRVFDVFFTTREGGTGLGLPIARRIAEEHGGTLALQSTPGRGTTATISLPTRPRS